MQIGGSAPGQPDATNLPVCNGRVGSASVLAAGRTAAHEPGEVLDERAQ